MKLSIYFQLNFLVFSNYTETRIRAAVMVEFLKHISSNNKRMIKQP